MPNQDVDRSDKFTPREVHLPFSPKIIRTSDHYSASLSRRTSRTPSAIRTESQPPHDFIPRHSPSVPATPPLFALLSHAARSYTMQDALSTNLNGVHLDSVATPVNNSLVPDIKIDVDSTEDSDVRPKAPRRPASTARG